MKGFQREKEALYDAFLTEGNITDKRVLKAFLQVPRERFIPSRLRPYAYDDRPLPIGQGQTISQPTTVLLMTQWLEVKSGMKVLEIGTGSGYQAALLSYLVGKAGNVFTIETIKALYAFGKKNLASYKNVTCIHADGSLGHVKEAPFDKIMVTAATPKLPEHLLKQLKKSGILLAPVGDLYSQSMIRIRKGKKPENFGDFIFVPLTGKFGKDAT